MQRHLDLRQLVGFMVLLVSLTLISSPTEAQDWKSGLGLGFEKMQKVWQGISKSPKMTQCKLASRKVYKGKQICVYKGANNTFLGIYNDAGGFCSNAMSCRYDPNSGKTIRPLVTAFVKAQDKMD